MNYGMIKPRDIADGPGVRVSLFVSGCTNHCDECFQPETWDFDYGNPFTKDVEDRIIEYLKPEYISGLTLLGGDPFERPNQKALLPFLKRVKDELPKKDIWAFSGYTLEEISDFDGKAHTEVSEQMLSLIDVLVDGRYVKELHDISLRFRGSSNQRLIDMNKTREQGKVVTWTD